MEDVKTIIERARKGDKEAFALLYHSYYIPIYRYCRVRLPSKEDAEDIAQEVFLKAWKAFGSFTLEGASALPFFYTIAKNAIIDFRKKKRLPEVSDENMDIPEDETPQTLAVAAEDQGIVYKLLSSLTDNERDAIIMKFIDGLSNTEISDRLGRSEEAIRQAQSRGLRKLKSFYE